MMGSRVWTTSSERVTVFTAALVLSVLTGALVAELDFIWIIALLCVIAAMVLLVSREALLWFVLVAGLVVVGVSQMYLPEAKYLKYIPPLAAMGLLLHVFAELLVRPPTPVPASVRWFLGFLLISMISMAVNWDSFGMAVVGLKGYYPMWAVFLGLALIHWRPAVIDTLPKAALLLAFLQLPFVAHQFLYLVPLRQGIPGVVAVDIVSGTFGGAVYGGGANAVLTLFLMTVVACLLGLWRQRAISAAVATIGTVVLLIPVFVNSSRVALLYLPIAFCVVFSSEVIRHPLRAAAGLILTACLVMGMLTTYTMLDQTPGTHTWRDLVTKTYDNQLATERERADNYSGFSRWTVLTFWAERQRRANPMQILIGYGPGASRVREEGFELAETLAEGHFGGRQIGYTAAAALLWEVGVAGLLAVLMMFWAGYRQAAGLAAQLADSDPVRAGIAHGLRASVVILAISLAHKDFLAFHVPFQTFLACVFGYLAAQSNRVRRSADATAGHALAPIVGRLP